MLGALKNATATVLCLLMLPVGVAVHQHDHGYWEILREQRRPARFLLSRVLMRTGLCRLFRIRRDGYVLRFHPTSISAALWIDPNDRRDDEDFFRGYLRPGDAVIDVGANIGSTSLACSAAIVPAGQVLAIEPHPSVFRVLRSNLAENDAWNVTAVQTALGEQAGTAHLSDRSADDWNYVRESGIEVPLRTLDEVAAGSRPTELLKIDIEGYELPALRGGREVLGRTECVYFEVSTEHTRRYGYHPAELLEFLRGEGFQVFHRPHDGKLTPVADDFVPHRVQDLIAVRRPERLRERLGCVTR